MKKILIALLISLILTGCSANNLNKTDTNNVAPVHTNTKQEQITPPLPPQKQQTTTAQKSTEDKDWFVGAIGNSMIYAKFDISGNRI